MTRKQLLLSILSALAVACSSSEKKETPVQNAQPTALEPAQIAPLKLEDSIHQFAFGSCSNQKQPQPIWEAVLAQHPQLYVGMGDNVYASKPEDKPIADQYKLQAQVPEFKKLRAEIPVIAVWDDHDFGQNDGGADNPEKDEARAEFLKFFPTDAARLSPYQKGIYHSFLLGQAPRRVQILFLDTRYFRSPLEKNPNPKHPLDIYQPTRDPKKTLLGEEQWAWLESELKTPAEVRFVVSSIQLIAEDHGFEKWANFPKDRQRFFDLLKKTKAKNVIVLSGDRHMAEVSRMKIPGWGELLDVTSSGINRGSNITEETNRHRVGSFFTPVNFGLARIDWEQQNVDIQIRDVKGEVAMSVQQKIQLPKNSKTAR